MSGSRRGRPTPARRWAQSAVSRLVRFSSPDRQQFRGRPHRSLRIRRTAAQAHREHAADHEVVVVFDSECGADGRQHLDPTYKKSRRSGDHSPMASYLDVLRVLDIAGISWLESDMAEADDVIASLVRVAVGRGRPVSILSTDKDFFQLLSDPRVCVLNTQLRADRRVIRADHIVDRFGISPSQWVEYRALTGDPADDIPGISGIGPKTASALLSRGADLETLRPTLRLHRRAAVRRAVQQWDDLIRWRALIRLSDDIAVPPSLLTGRTTPELALAAQLVSAAGLW